MRNPSILKLLSLCMEGFSRTRAYVCMSVFLFVCRFVCVSVYILVCLCPSVCLYYIFSSCSLAIAVVLLAHQASSPHPLLSIATLAMSLKTLS